MESLQNQDFYDGSEQGQKAIAFGIQTNRGEGWENYDFTKSQAADFNWPDIPRESVGSLEPWLCIQYDIDGEKCGGWQDLNAILGGEDRKMSACYRTLGMPESVEDDYDEALEIINEILEADDVESSAKEHGFKSHAAFTIEEHVKAVKWKWAIEHAKAWGETQKLMDEQAEQSNVQMNANIDAAKAGGLMDAIHGVTLEDWAGANAKIAQATPIDEILSILQIESPQWDEVNMEWQGRMSRDTSFAIAKVYGDAFTNPNIGKFASADGADANAGGEPCSFEDYVKIGVHMDKGTEQGLDPQTILAEHGKTVMDWSAIGMYWSKEYHKNLGKYFPLEEEYRNKYEKEYGGASIADDIDF